MHVSHDTYILVERLLWIVYAVNRAWLVESLFVDVLMLNTDSLGIARLEVPCCEGWLQNDC